MIDAGAQGYVGKDRVADCLLDAIRVVHGGGTFVDGADAAAEPVAAPVRAQRRASAAR
jgi:DNA-binding NarL/FixJ family response regulator